MHDKTPVIVTPHSYCEARERERNRSGHCKVTRGNHRLNIGQFRLTPGHLIGQLRVGKGYLMVTVGQQG